MSQDNNKLGVVALTMVIISAMIGGGVFNIPQNIAADAGVGPSLIAWAITAIGVWFLANTFRILSAARPEAKAGLFSYGQIGFGPFVGFFSAWGYWIANIFANVAYAVLLMGSLNFFYPGMFTGGNNLNSVIGGSIVIWVMYFIVQSGVKNVSSLNTIGTIAKIVPLVLFIIIAGSLFDLPQFMTNFWGTQDIPAAHEKNLGTIFDQIKHTMLVTLWMYLGIEGAVVVSDKARNQKDVGRATKLAFIISTSVYVLISTLSYGIFSLGELSVMQAPSTAEILLKKVGPWGEYLMNVGMIVAVLSSWLIWTIMLAELPYVAAKANTFPKRFAESNDKGTASFSMIISTIIMQGAMILVYFSHNAWTLMLSMTSFMFVPCYIVCILYLMKISFSSKESYPDDIFASRTYAKITSVFALIYGLWLIYAAGVQYMLIACIVYALGIPIYFMARKENAENKTMFDTKGEGIFALSLCLLGAAGVVYLGFNYKTFLG